MSLLSIIIPTHRRPHLLTRAIASAVQVHAGLDIEVLVIPNGPDSSWKAVAEQHQHDPRIRWHYLPTGNACAARNHGLATARGQYLRFLDDDDYLLPAAADQLDLTDKKQLDVCSAPLENTTSDGVSEGAIPLPATQDFTVATIHSIVGVSLTQGSLFRRAFIQDLRWREDVTLYDDYFWMLDLAAAQEAIWMQTAAPVCSYVQHHGARLSRVRRSGQNSRYLVNVLLQLEQQLCAQGRQSSERKNAIATALLTHAHSAFPASPAFLSKIIQQAFAISSTAKPLQPIFETYPWLARHLLAVEWATLLPRYLSRGYRRATWLAGALLDRFDNSAKARIGTHDL